MEFVIFGIVVLIIVASTAKVAHDTGEERGFAKGYTYGHKAALIRCERAAQEAADAAAQATKQDVILEGPPTRAEQKCLDFAKNYGAQGPTTLREGHGQLPSQDLTNAILNLDYSELEVRTIAAHARRTDSEGESHDRANCEVCIALGLNRADSKPG